MADPARARLLSWYDREKRELPWRGTKDPYAVWVSEIMLQQTRVDTVVPYYRRFLERFPTPASLAEAEEDAVLAVWSGLGYYRRARLLHAGVKEVVAKYGGRVPEDPDARLGLPGVGRYTAGAIGSIAFGRAEAIVDGNVARVLARLRCIDGPLGRAATDRELWTAAESFVKGPRPGDLNQALMELGATVCTPAKPDCDRCPIQTSCRALADGRVGELPMPRERKSPKPVDVVAVLATAARPPRAFLVRGEASLFGGLWGVPMIEGRASTQAREALRSHGIVARLPDAPARTLVHVLSHRRLTVRVFRATAARATSRRARPVEPAELSGLGLSTLTRRILEPWVER